MTKKEIKINDTFGFLLVIGKKNKRSFICKCQACGKIKTIYASQLLSGHIISCGCQMQKHYKVLERFKDSAYKKRLQTTKPNKNNKTGVRGVCWDKRRKKYIAYAEYNGKNKFLGRYNILEDAKKARELACIERNSIIDREVEHE